MSEAALSYEDISTDIQASLLENPHSDYSSRVIDLSGRYTPTEKQVIGHTSPERYVLYGGAMGGGKSAWIVNEMIQLLLDYPGNVGGIWRWEQRAFKNTTYLEILKFLPFEIVARHHKSDQYFELINSSRLLYGGLKPQPGQNEQGIDNIKSMTLGAFALDEASEVPVQYYNMLCSRLRLELPDIRYKGLLASNPEPGWVRDRFILNKYPDHKFVPALPSDNPHNPDDYVEQLLGIFPPDWVERYLHGSWDISDEGDNCYSYQLIKAAMEREFQEDAECDALSIDVAREGDDETVIAGRWGNVGKILTASSFLGTVPARKKLENYCDVLKPKRTWIDTVGVGGHLYDQFIADGYNGSQFVAGSDAKDKKRYANMKAEAYFHFKEELEAGNVSLPDDQRMASQAISVKYGIQNEKRIYILPKSQLVSGQVSSFDRIEAIIMSWYEGKGYRKKGKVFVRK